MSRRARGWALGLAVVLLLGAIAWRAFTRTDPLLELSPAERAAIYESGLESFAAICERKPLADASRAYCREQARFLRRFPECGQTCRERTEQFAGMRATR